VASVRKSIPVVTSLPKAAKYIGAAATAADARPTARPTAAPPTDRAADGDRDANTDATTDAISDTDADSDDLAAAAAAELPLQVFDVTSTHDGWRLDRALAALLPALSRSRLQQWIGDAAVRVIRPRGAPASSAPRARETVYAGDRIEVRPQRAPEMTAFTPEPMALDVVHQDDTILVLDKPPGLVVHPAAGHWSGTLLNGLLAFDPALARVPRAGIVHRLDADTSGLMVVARRLEAQTDLVRQLQARTVTREYWAVVMGQTPAEGTIDEPIGRDPRNPLRFAVSRAPAAREARTHFRRVAVVEADGRNFSWVACRLETGRTHQIRVHLEFLGHPLVGDPVYRRGRTAPDRRDDAPLWSVFARQALHACKLGLSHPASGDPAQWFRAPPADMRALMKSLGFGRTDRPLRSW
jgi:23S rRNA pseudouridine1911/1915/1917 synthase